MANEREKEKQVVQREFKSRERARECIKSVIKRDNISATFQTCLTNNGRDRFTCIGRAYIVTRCRDYIRNLDDRAHSH